MQPEQAIEAQAVATRLMIELCGARLLPGTIDVGGPGPSAEDDPAARRARQRICSAIEIPRPRCAEILEALEFATVDAADGLDVTVPAFRRADVTREADLIEEVARLGALDALPATLPSRHGASGRLTAAPASAPPGGRRARPRQGLHEIVGWSFVGPEEGRRLRIGDRRAVELQNPMSSEQSRLRTTLLGSLLDVARGNRARGAGAIRLFEAGAVYLPGRGAAARRALPRRGAAVGARSARRPGASPRRATADFFAAKGVLDGLLDALRVAVDRRARGQPEPFLHPGRAATIVVDGAPVGWIGEIHPQVAAGWDWSDPLAGFELDLDAVAASGACHAATAT